MVHGTVPAEGSSTATNKTMSVALKNAMLAGGGTMVASCDGVTAGTIGDGVDRIVDATDIIGNTPGSAHSWWLIFFGAALGWLLVDKDSTSDGGGAPGSVYWSPAAGFTGGSTTARPTATDEQEITNSTNLFTTSNGTFTYHWQRVTTVGQESFRFVATHSSLASGPNVILVLEKASTEVAAWTNRVIAKYVGGTSPAGDRSTWTAQGWQSNVAGTARALLSVGEVPPSATDPDGDRLAVPTGLNNTTIGRLGFVDDFFFVDDAVTNLATFSDEDGTRGWVVFDEVVMWWGDRSTDPGGGNIAGAKLLRTHAPGEADDTAPVVTAVTPVGVLPGTREQARRASITFNVTDDDPGVVSNPILIYTEEGRFEALYVSQLGGFVNGYTGTTAPISGGTQITVNAPTNGWWDDVRFYQWPVDGAGNVTA